MSNHSLPVVFTASDQKEIETKLRELQEDAGGSCTVSVFLHDANQLLVLLVREQHIVSWCLMHARDKERAHALAAVLDEVLKREHDVVCSDVAALTNAAIAHASQAARASEVLADAAIARAQEAARAAAETEALREARRRRNDTYPGEWDCG